LYSALPFLLNGLNLPSALKLEHRQLIVVMTNPITSLMRHKQKQLHHISFSKKSS